jgi:hypothetical protein
MFLFALALAQTAPFDTKADYVQLARAYCERTWPNNFSMQEYCLKQQAAGMLAFKDASDSIGKPLEKALEQCTEDWTKDRLPDWEMVGMCASKQAEAYRNLHPASP